MEVEKKRDVTAVLGSLATAMAPPRLPPELISLIVAFVEDTKTLISASLAALCFLEPCQKRLFRRLEISVMATLGNRGPAHVVKFFSKHPHLAHYVTELGIAMGRSYHASKLRPAAGDSMAAALKLLQRVKYLHIFTPNWIAANWRDFPSIVTEAVVSYMDGLPANLDGITRIRLTRLGEIPEDLGRFVLARFPVVSLAHSAFLVGGSGARTRATTTTLQRLSVLFPDLIQPSTLRMLTRYSHSLRVLVLHGAFPLNRLDRVGTTLLELTGATPNLEYLSIDLSASGGLNDGGHQLGPHAQTAVNTGPLSCLAHLRHFTIAFEYRYTWMRTGLTPVTANLPTFLAGLLRVVNPAEYFPSLNTLLLKVAVLDASLQYEGSKPLYAIPKPLSVLDDVLADFGTRTRWVFLDSPIERDASASAVQQLGRPMDARHSEAFADALSKALPTAAANGLQVLYDDDPWLAVMGEEKFDF
ncbi:hypothetical protein HMN09_01001100 [Mycena chlorophos]|uniref:Uncharacterized protein n=1 Tax=Mycena chlorophos TaxID=658473 RepID=A0A8H6SLB4_MYCCL|nr:hypothetical protein HMN09_01001100 [Mycena chlorophos]